MAQPLLAAAPGLIPAPLHMTALDDLFERASQAVAQTTLDGCILAINRGFTAVFGYAPENAIGKNLEELIGRTETEAQAPGERVDSEGVFRRQDGSLVRANFTYLPTGSPGQDHTVYAVYREVSQESNTPAAPLTLNETHWQAIFDNSPLGIAIADNRGKFIATNRAYQEIVGFTEQELATMTYLDVTREEDRPSSAALVEDMLSGRRPRFHNEKRYVRKDGRSVWVRITAANVPGTSASFPIGFAIAEDITERHQSEARLQEFETIVENLQEMILVIDRDYRYLIANRAYLNYRNLKKEQVVGCTVREIVTPAAFDGIVKERIDQCFQGQEVTYQLDVTYPILGQRRIQAYYLPISSAAGVDRIVIVLEDITERRRMEQELQRSLAELHALNGQLDGAREEERTRLARDLHDQLGQELTGIKFALASLKARAAQDQVDSIEAIMKLVDGTIHAVRKITTELRPAILDDLGLEAAIEYAAQEFQTSTGIRCEVSFPPQDLSVDPGHATALFRIVQECLTNIARHSGATQIRITLATAHDHLVLEVRDNGCGIDEARLAGTQTLGIVGMRERSFLMGGEFTIGRGPDCGTIVRVRVPAN